MAGTATGNLFDIEAPAFEEIINKDVDIILPTLDPAWRDTFVSNQGVFPQSQLGRQWKAIRILRGTYTGVIDAGVSRGDFTLFGEGHTRYGDKMLIQSIDERWPDPLEGPKPGSIRLACPVESMNTNLALSWQELQAEASPAYIGQVIAPILEGFARNIAHTLCNSWYTSQNSDYDLATVGASGVGQGIHPQYGSLFELHFETAEMTPNRFYRGMRVDVYSTDVTAQSTTSSLSSTHAPADVYRGNDTAASEKNQTVDTRINLIVEYVDELANTVRLVTPTDPDSWGNGNGFTLAVGDHIKPANMKTGRGNFTGIAGINSWLKDGADGVGTASAKLLGDRADAVDFVDVTLHPEYKSLITDVSGPLTEPLLMTILRRFHSSKDRYGMGIDCLIASDGVWLEYFRQLVPQFTRERSGRLANITDEGLTDGFSFTADGRNYMGYTSTYIEDGVVYGLKKGGNNWERVVPPFPNRATTMSEIDPFIPFRFVLPAILNTNQTRALIYDTASGGGSSRVTEFVQLPGTLHMNLMPKQPAGIKLTGVTSYTYWP